MLRNLVFTLLLTVSVVSCAKPLSMSNERLSNVSPDEGVVVGSILIKTRKYEGRKLFKYKFKGVKCDVKVQKFKTESEDKADNPGWHKIRAIADGDEVPFVTVLPAGRYEFGRITVQVFADPQFGYMSASFNVFPGQVTYIGKLEITLPEYARYGFAIGTEVKDTQDATVASLLRTYPNLDETLSKQLMVGRDQKNLRVRVSELPPSEAVNEYIKVIEGKDLHYRRVVCKAIERQKLFDPKILESVSKVLLAEFGMDLSALDKMQQEHHIDTMAWYCKILGLSGNKAYIETLEQVVKETDHGKLNGYATRSLNQLRAVKKY